VPEIVKVQVRNAQIGHRLTPLGRPPEVRPPKDAAAPASEDQRFGFWTGEVAEMPPQLRDDRLGERHRPQPRPRLGRPDDQLTRVQLHLRLPDGDRPGVDVKGRRRSRPWRGPPTAPLEHAAWALVTGGARPAAHRAKSATPDG
jgi:hypothetical protein